MYRKIFVVLSLFSILGGCAGVQEPAIKTKTSSNSGQISDGLMVGRVTTEIAPTPWNQKTHLLHIGIKGYNIPKEKLPPANLVFLVDVSGSMESPNKLDLLKSSLKLLSQQLTTKDKVSLVVYAGASGLVLEPTPGNQSRKIIAALSRLGG